MAFGTGSGLVGFLSLAKNEIVSNTLKYHTNLVQDIIFNEDDTRAISVAYEHIIYVWNTVDFNRANKIVEAHRGSINQVIFHDGGIITVGGDAFVKQWTGVL